MIPISNEVHESSLKHHGNFLFKVKKFMIVTTDKHDAWLIKGFDGITNMILNRANQELAPQKYYVDELERSIYLLDKCLAVTQEGMNTNCDAAIFMGLSNLTGVLLKRSLEMNMGKIVGTNWNQLHEYVQRLKIALPRLRERQIT